MNTSLLSRVVLHLAVCAGYPWISYCIFELHHRLVGVAASRGADAELSMMLVFLLFLGVNLAMIGTERIKIKIPVLLLMVILILFYLLPNYPLRAMAFSAVSGGLTVCAILLSRPFEAWLNGFWKRWS